MHSKAENEQLINDNYGLLVQIVKEFNPYNQDEFTEFFQQAAMGFILGYNDYDDTFNCKLSSFIAKRARWSIIAYLRSKKKASVEFKGLEDCPTLTGSVSYSFDEYSDIVSEKEQQVLEYKLVHRCTFTEIADKIGCTKQGASYIYYQGIEKIKDVILK